MNELRTSDKRLTDQELTYQLIRLETRADLNLGDLPAAQVLRDAARHIELKSRAIERARVLLHDASAQTGEYEVSNWMAKARAWVKENS
jgi:hypothetical protein